MSKINRIRMINLNYNNNTMRIDDETFYYGGDSTLMSLRNGGGKSVFVQMVIALFVRGNYRNIADRQFKDYFTTSQPTIIMAEWKLDGDNGYALTGMLVRRSPSAEENTLDIYNFVAEYKTESSCEYCIDRIGFVEKKENAKVLNSFGNCKKLLEEYRTQSKGVFNYYDMHQNSKAYFERIKQYQIDQREWETIIRRINLKESGLSELFKDAKDEKGLTEKWFLTSVENKLNRDENMIENFAVLVEKYIKSYKENEKRIAQQKGIEHFKEASKDLTEQAERLCDAEKSQVDYENRIACLYAGLQEISKKQEIQINSLETQINDLSNEINFKKREKYSFNIYSYQDSLDAAKKDYSHVQSVLRINREEAAQLRHRLLAVRCAGTYAEYREALLGEQEYAQKVRICQEENDKMPETEAAGAILYTRMTENESQKQAVFQTAKEELTEKQLRSNELIQAKERFQKEIFDGSARLGRYREKCRVYDRYENDFNKNFGENLQRTITGTYEPDTMEKLERSYQEQLDMAESEYTQLNKKCILQKEQLENDIRRKRKLEDDMLLLKSRQKEADIYMEKLQSYVERRKELCRYIDAGQDMVLDSEYLEQEFSKKLDSIMLRLNGLSIEQSQCEKELKKLSQGVLLELPAQFTEKLETLGIHMIYGMEWLKKNGCSQEENEAFVKNNPFTPYSIILTGADFQKLESSKPDVYTSFPVPIVLKEQLTKHSETAAAANVLNLDKVRFYVMFNNNLLDEEKLAEMIDAKMRELDRLTAESERRREEVSVYRNYLYEIKSHGLSQKIWEKAEKECKECNESIAELKKETDRVTAAVSEVEALVQEQLEGLKRLEEQIRKTKQKQEKYAELMLDYEEYLKALNNCDEESEKLDSNRKKLDDTEREIENLQAEQNVLRQKLRDVEAAIKELQKNISRYESYKDIKVSEKFDGLKSQETKLLEARFEALCEEFQSDLRALQQELSRYAVRKNECLKRLELMAGKENGAQQNVSEEEYLAVYEQGGYGISQEQEIEALLNKKQEEVERRHEREKELVARQSELQARLDSERKFMKSETGYLEPVEREVIIQEDFDHVIAVMEQDYRQRKDDFKKLSVHREQIESNIAALAEYEQFQVVSEYDFEAEDGIQLEYADRKELNSFRGMLVRDYKEKCRTAAYERNHFKDALMKQKGMPDFAEDTFSVPLETLLSMAADSAGSILLEQLHMVIEGFERIQEKLKADLEHVASEKEHLIQTMLSYVHRVHDNLGKIDKNSTIRLHDTPVKMLRLILPEWSENEMRIRLEDYIEQVRRSGMVSLSRNETIDEVVANAITTNRLYDAVVGSTKVGIHLYKIEGERQRQISWAEVAKNSGGEGFLSAFVVLSSLLYYMRWDDTDLFAEKNEGKVLIMDNPFAQTTSAHLLKPLMEIAKKTNTQLICLSGINGESVYDCFDNIYVLHLKNAYARDGISYIRPEHLRGGMHPEQGSVGQTVRDTDSEEIVPARVYVEQERLF